MRAFAVLAALAVLAAFGLLAGLALLAARGRQLARDVARLSGLLGEHSDRLEAAERDAARALAAAEVAGSVLVEKGVADEEDLEAARARSVPADGARGVPGRDGELLH